jgi:cytochrome c553
VKILLVQSLCAFALGCAQAPVLAQGQRGGAPQRAPDTMEARVAACIGCHGDHGRGVENVYFPRLAGKPAGYLYNQLVAFRDGRRKYVPMNYLLAYLPDEYLRKMADYFAAQNPPPLVQPAVARPAQLLHDGQRIASQGVPARKIPPCMSCHGTELNGREPGIPGLLGLRADYISAQLGAWRYGVRTALVPDCMQVVASSLTEAEVGAVAAWLASLPVGGARPHAAGPAQLPLACGSQHPGQEARR